MATPDDEMVRIGYPDLFPPDCDEIHISVTFTHDVPQAEKMAEAWRSVAPAKLGGPALNDEGNEFIPGRYLKTGYVITSRGCPNKCWFCMVPRREGNIRELSIKDGWRIQDNNLLACSKNHIREVFAMLSRQPERAVFQGGIEAARMEPWIANSLALLKPRSIYFAYDLPADKEALASAILMMRKVDYDWGHALSAYVLIGYPHDTCSAAEERLCFVLALGVLPFAMLYRDDVGKVDQEWRKFQREWCRPKIVGSKLRDILPARHDRKEG
jgi:hypothetical protein